MPKILLLLCLIKTVQAQDSVKVQYNILGNDTLIFHTTVYYPHNAAVAFINLHDDENTSVEAGLDFISRYGGTLFQLQHKGDRIVDFNVDSLRYGFDPNRIFTDAGRGATLKKHGGSQDSAAVQVKKIADSILAQQVNGREWVVALHNNSERGLNIRSYKKGGSEYGNATKVFVSRTAHPHDFILTTEHKVYHHLKQKGINVVLQHREPADDGSLSVYAARNGIRYINIEALQGHLQEQVKMLEAIKDIITY